MPQVSAADWVRVARLQALVDAARAAADGDSNDAEIAALQEALEAALERWPEIKPNETPEEGNA